MRAAVVIFLVLCAEAQQPSLQQRIESAERQELDCLKTGDLAGFAALLAEEAVFVDSHGAAGRVEVVKNTAAFHLDDYTMEDVKFVPVSSSSGLIAYKLTERGTSHGKAFSATVHVSALWTERSGRWQCLFSQETAAR